MIPKPTPMEKPKLVPSKSSDSVISEPKQVTSTSIKETTIYHPEPMHDYPAYDPEHSNCRKYVPTSKFLFDLYCIIRKANQNLGIALHKTMIEEKLLVSK